MAYCNLEDAFQEPFRFKTKNQKPIEYDVKLNENTKQASYNHLTKQASYNHLNAEKEFTQDIALVTPPNPFTSYEYYENDLPHFNDQQPIYPNQPQKLLNESNMDKMDKLERLEQKIDEMNSKMNMVLSGITKLGNPRSEQENLHDIILFGVFGVFFIYILDQMRRKK